MFATVRYDDQEQIVNTNCRNVILLQFIKKKIGCSTKDVVELSDERGKVKNLRGFPEDYARKYIKDRERLIVLKVHYHSSSISSGKNVPDRAVYTPLLKSLVSNSEFIAALNPPEEEALHDILSSKSSRTRSSTLEGNEFRRARSKSSLSSSSRRSSKRGRKNSRNHLQQE